MINKNKKLTQKISKFGYHFLISKTNKHEEKLLMEFNDTGFEKTGSLRERLLTLTITKLFFRFFLLFWRLWLTGHLGVKQCLGAGRESGTKSK